MAGPDDENGTHHVPLRALVPYLAIAFGLAWTILGLYVFLPAGMTSVFGPLSGNHPLFFLAVYAPALAAFGLVVRYQGVAGLRRFLGRALRWRCRWEWWVFLLAGVPLIFVLGSAWRGNLLTDAFPFDSLGATLTAVALAAIKGPVEEFGWRGLALPLLQRRFAPLRAGLILGAIWGVWHAPAFLLGGTPQSEWSFVAFFVGCLAISVIATALYNDTRGSILLTAFFHFTLMNPLFPDAQPYDTWLLVGCASWIVWKKRTEMLVGESAVRRVVPAE
jgi:membrane protease YdiL (CAAX protease family)